MSKRWIWGIGCLVALMTHAQNYTFETDYTNWSAQQGALTLSGDHYKQGEKSLCWTTTGKSALLVKSFTQYSMTTANGCYMQIYSPEATGDTLVVEFLNGTSVKRTATWICNYQGWREFNRAYNEYASTASATINALRITLRPTDPTAGRTIWIDDVKLNTTPDANRVPGTQWVADWNYMKVRAIPISLYSNGCDLPTTTPTAQELADLKTIRSRILSNPAYNAPQAIIAKNWVLSNISVTRDANGRVLGSTIINTGGTALTEEKLKEIGNRLQILAGGKMNQGTGVLQQAFDDYLDVLLDQGLDEGANIYFASNSYSAPRAIIPYFVSILPACNDEQRDRIARLIAWMSYYHMAYYPEDSYLAGNVSDVIYLFLPYMQAAAAARPNDADAVRELKAIQRFMNRNAEYVPGGKDMLKPDGTGFHHSSHYNNYMYAYQTYMTGIYQFRNTCFEVCEQTYRHFGKAVISLYIMATPGSDDKRFFPNSLAGRNPFGSGNSITFSKSLFGQLIQSGDSYPEVQQQYKAAYNHFFRATTYSVPEENYDGCYQFNYSPIAVARKGDWLAVMRAPTSKFWGAELYSKENRFGRYQSHGSLDVMYKGSSLAYSGMPTNGTGGGWDWNVVPGTTTVHYTSWTEMMPNKSQTQRFDQYSGGTNFSGALADEQYGIFATNLSQSEKYGNSYVYTATNLKAHKSVFILDSILVAIGSDISTSGTYSDQMITATNLFQNIISPTIGKLNVNGKEVASATNETLQRNTYNYMVSPTGTGYYLPASNAPVQLIYGSQTTPKETGDDYTNPSTTLTAAKAYINHGVKGNDGKYEFAVVPATNATAMAEMAAAMNAGKIYTVRQQDSKVHAVSGGNVIAYAFYSAALDMKYGIVRSTTHQHLLLVRDLGNDHYRMAACNPNLEPQTDAVYGWVATPTETTLTLDGEWKGQSEVDGVIWSAPINGKTDVTLHFSEGEALQWTTVPYNEPTDIPNTRHKVPVTKYMQDGQVYIRRGGKTYDILGQGASNK